MISSEVSPLIVNQYKFDEKQCDNPKGAFGNFRCVRLNVALNSVRDVAVNLTLAVATVFNYNFHM